MLSYISTMMSLVFMSENKGHLGNLYQNELNVIDNVQIVHFSDDVSGVYD